MPGRFLPPRSSGDPQMLLPNTSAAWPRSRPSCRRLTSPESPARVRPTARRRAQGHYQVKPATSQCLRNAPCAGALTVRGFRVQGSELMIDDQFRRPVMAARLLRHAGRSKASWREAARYLRQLVALRAATAVIAGRRSHPDITRSVDDPRRRLKQQAGTDRPQVTSRGRNFSRANVKPVGTVDS
jgi:hypothetical protein